MIIFELSLEIIKLEKIKITFLERLGFLNEGSVVGAWHIYYRLWMAHF